MSIFNVRKTAGKKSFRKKIVVTDEEDEDETSSRMPLGSAGPSLVAATKGTGHAGALKTSTTTRKAGTTLSFIGDEGDEEDKDVFKIKKKKDHTKRLAQMMAREKKKGKKLESGNVSKLKTEEGRPNSRDESEDDVGSESSAEDESGPRILAGDEAVDNQADGQLFPAVHVGLGNIPDSSTVHAIRKRRELMRQMGHTFASTSSNTGTATSVSYHSTRSHDYVPLDKRASTAKGDSRLVREDDNDHSDNDDDGGGGGGGGRDVLMSFGQQSAPTTQQRVIMALEGVAGEEEDEDEEMRRWEEEQISKGEKITKSGPGHHHRLLRQDVDPHQLMAAAAAGGGGVYQPPPLYGFGSSSSSSSASSSVPHSHQHHAGPGGPVQQQQSWARDPLSRLPHTLAPVTLASLRQRLTGQLAQLTEEHSKYDRALASSMEELDICARDIDTFEEQTTSLAEDYKLYQEKRAYFRNLLGCLGEKNAEICALEEKVLELWSRRSERLVSRRKQDVLDLMEECSHSDGAAKQSVSVELDSFGRDQSLLREEARKQRMANLAGRRRRRREARERIASREKNVAPPPEGLSTDDEEIQSDMQRAALELSKMREDASCVFEDVVEEFCSLPVIMRHFEDWKAARPQTYNDAYISLSAQKVFVPFVRLEMMFWNPLEVQCTAIEDHSWFRTLLFYGHREGEQVEPEDEDNLLLPHLIEVVVLSKIKMLVEKVWDPLSSTQTRRLTTCLEKIQKDYPTLSPLTKSLREVLKTVLMRLRKCLDTDVFIPLYSKQQLRDTSSMHYQFYQSQFWKAVKLFGSICLWVSTVGRDQKQIKELAVDGLLNRYLVMALQNLPPLCDNAEKLSKLVGMIPYKWLEGEGHADFRSLVRCAIQQADELNQSTIAHPDPVKRKVKTAVQTLTDLLRTIKAEEEAELMKAAYI